MARCRICVLNMSTYAPSCLANAVSSNASEHCFYLNAREILARGRLTSPPCQCLSQLGTSCGWHLPPAPLPFQFSPHCSQTLHQIRLRGWFDMHMPSGHGLSFLVSLFIYLALNLLDMEPSTVNASVVEHKLIVCGPRLPSPNGNRLRCQRGVRVLSNARTTTSGL